MKTTHSKLEPYEAPVVVVLGSLYQLTLDLKVGAFCDHNCHHHGSAHHHGGIYHHGSV